LTYKELLYKMDRREVNEEQIRELSKRARAELLPFFNPSSIAVVGASRKKGSVGWVIFKNLIENARNGLLKAKVYGVNIKGGVLFGEPLYKRLSEIKGLIDHVVIAVPSKVVPEVVDEAGRKGAKVVTIISSGFSEVGNIELEKEVLEVARKYKIRVLGPNGLGLFDNYSGVDTLFLPPYKEIDGTSMLSTPRPPKGFVAFLSQSGALGAALLDYMYGEQMGVSKFLSVGNKIDVDEIDLLLWSINDPTIRVIMFYVEGIKGRGDILVKIGKFVAKKKPIVVLKGGKTAAGARAAASHTASMAGDFSIFMAAMREMGAIAADNLTDFLDAAKALSFQPPARGNNIAILTNGGGAGILAADCAERIGLKVYPLPEDTLKEFKELVKEGTIPDVATFANPIDLSAEGDSESYLAALELLLEDPRIEGVVLIAIHQPPRITHDLPQKIAMLASRYKKPITAVDIGGSEMSNWFRNTFDQYGIPSFPTPERAVRAMKSLVDYGVWLVREGIFEEFIESWERPMTAQSEQLKPLPLTSG